MQRIYTTNGTMVQTIYPFMVYDDDDDDDDVDVDDGDDDDDGGGDGGDGDDSQLHNIHLGNGMQIQWYMDR